MLSQKDMAYLNIPDMVSRLDSSRRNDRNPLAQGVPLKSKNLFIDVIEFALSENEDLLYFDSKDDYSWKNSFQ